MQIEYPPGLEWLKPFVERLQLLVHHPMRKGMWGPRKPYEFERAWIGLIVQVHTQVWGPSGIDDIWSFDEKHPILLPLSISFPSENATHRFKYSLEGSLRRKIPSLCGFDPKVTLEEAVSLVKMCTNYREVLLKNPDMEEIRQMTQHIANLSGHPEKADDFYDRICLQALEVGLRALRADPSELRHGRLIRHNAGFRYAMSREEDLAHDPWIFRRTFITRAFERGRGEFLPVLAHRLFQSFPQKGVLDWIVECTSTYPYTHPKGALSTVPLGGKEGALTSAHLGQLTAAVETEEKPNPLESLLNSLRGFNLGV